MWVTLSTIVWYVPGMPREKKDAFFPKIRMFGWKLQNYQAAVNVLCQREGSRHTFTSWVTEVLDDASESVFARHDNKRKPCPSDDELQHSPRLNPVLPRKRG